MAQKITGQKLVTIVIPVYADWSSLKDCIESLKQYVDSRHKILLVNDCGPDADVLETNIKQNIEGLSNFSYFKNPKNLGFVGTCNRAVFELDKTDNDILLLNSDTKATSGFLDEMLAVLYSKPKIGAVSPRSNNATIATVPLSAISRHGLGIEQSFKIFNQLKTRLPRFNEVPTAHGFCMLIRRPVIKKYGLFDEIFGKGYGEEVDFCQRIQRAGYLSVLSNRSYVIHLEARSFSLESKKKILEEHNQIIRQRYPGYQKSVRDYIERELKLEEELYTSTQTESIFRRNIKRNPTVHRLARQTRKLLKRQSAKEQ